MNSNRTTQLIIVHVMIYVGNKNTGKKETGDNQGPGDETASKNQRYVTIHSYWTELL